MNTECFFRINLADVEPSYDWPHGKTLSSAEVADRAIRALNFKIKYSMIVDGHFCVQCTHAGDGDVCLKWLAERLNTTINFE